MPRKDIFTPLLSQSLNDGAAFFSELCETLRTQARIRQSFNLQAEHVEPVIKAAQELHLAFRSDIEHVQDWTTLQQVVSNYKDREQEARKDPAYMLAQAYIHKTTDRLRALLPTLPASGPLIS